MGVLYSGRPGRPGVLYHRPLYLNPIIACSIDLPLISNYLVSLVFFGLEISRGGFEDIDKDLSWKTSRSSFMT